MVKCLQIRDLPEDADVEGGIQTLTQQPEEDVDESTPVSPTSSNMTENGNVVDQEHGKEHVFPRPESNPYQYS